MFDTEEIRIRKMSDSQIEEGLHLIWTVFQEFVAPDYSQEGRDYFYNKYMDGGFRSKLAAGKESMYGAYVGDKLAGVLSYSERNTVSCVFVDGNYHRMGIGKKLFETILQKLRKQGVTEVKLNASPYALPFYRHIGFEETGAQASYNGILYTPMKLLL